VIECDSGFLGFDVPQALIAAGGVPQTNCRTQVRDAFQDDDGSHTPAAAPSLLHPLMRLLDSFLKVLGLAGPVQEPVQDRPSSVSTLDAYIARETHTARSGLLANIGPDGDKSHGVLVRTPSPSLHDILMTVLFFYLHRRV
jgi:hypothetical protein